MKQILIFVSILVSGSAFAANQSTYTSIAKADCQTIQDSENEKDAPIDYYTGHCPGKNGYTVVISGGDLRYSLSLKFGRKEINLTQIGSFHDLGADKVEWRGPRGGQYTSIIYRLNIAQGDEGKDKSYLYVARLAGANTCIIGIVPPGANMNQQARDLADDEYLPCLSKANN